MAAICLIATGCSESNRDPLADSTCVASIGSFEVEMTQDGETLTARVFEDDELLGTETAPFDDDGPPSLTIAGGRSGVLVIATGGNGVIEQRQGSWTNETMQTLCPDLGMATLADIYTSSAAITVGESRLDLPDADQIPRGTVGALSQMP
jgi:hypothetical protein